MHVHVFQILEMRFEGFISPCLSLKHNPVVQLAQNSADQQTPCQPKKNICVPFYSLCWKYPGKSVSMWDREKKRKAGRGERNKTLKSSIKNQNTTMMCDCTKKKRENLKSWDLSVKLVKVLTAANTEADTLGGPC